MEPYEQKMVLLWHRVAPLFIFKSVGSVKRFSRDVEAIRTLDVNEDTDG